MTNDEFKQLQPGDIIYYIADKYYPKTQQGKKKYGVYVKPYLHYGVWARWSHDFESHDFKDNGGWMAIGEVFLEKPSTLIEVHPEYEGLFE